MRNKINLIFLNKNLNCTILKNKKNTKLIYFFNKIKFYYFIFNLKSIYINKNLNSLIFKNNYEVFNNKIIELLVNDLSLFYYKKITFNGKGFKIRKKNFINSFFFNNSHIKILLEQKNKILKTSKNSFLYLYKKNNSNSRIKFLLNLFKQNVFTKKGIKLSRQILLVKKIKKK